MEKEKKKKVNVASKRQPSKSLFITVIDLVSDTSFTPPDPSFTYFISHTATPKRSPSALRVCVQSSYVSVERRRRRLYIGLYVNYTESEFKISIAIVGPVSRIVICAFEFSVGSGFFALGSYISE